MLIQTKNIIPTVGQKTGVSDFGTDATGFAVFIDGKIVAGAVYNNLRYQNDVQLSFFADNPRWATREHIEGILSYPFKYWACRRITTLTPKDKKHVVDFNKRIGFKVEGIAREAFPNQDAVICGLTFNDYLERWQNGRRR